MLCQPHGNRIANRMANNGVCHVFSRTTTEQRANMTERPSIPTAALECITTWRAEKLLERNDLPMPISGDATTKAREYPKGWIMSDCL